MTDDELTEIEKRANVATAGLIAALRDARAALAETRYAALMAAGVRGGPHAWRWESDAAGTTLDDDAAWERLLGEMRPRQDRAIRNLLGALAHAFECVGTEAERPKGGMSVSFHGDFASAVRLPSVVGEMRSWAKRSRDVLRGDERAVATWSGEPIGEREGRAACTGIAATWCPVCGDCVCTNRGEYGDREDSPTCPLHSSASKHAEPVTESLHCPVCELPGLPPDAREWPSHEPIWTDRRRYLCSGCGAWLTVKLDDGRAYLAESAEDGK